MGLFDKWKAPAKRSEGKRSKPAGTASDGGGGGGGSAAEGKARGAGSGGAMEKSSGGSESTIAANAMTSVFEFGSASSSTNAARVTLAGYCPVSDELEPCRWEILPSGGDEAPQFRIIF
ncbi:hypothetical protein CBR_g8168 [Chara braunii]|uniref:Uncharacterized protein n=1 Tax=Chara braunii TaxID=69332 RepID=A0A388KLJ5_CHABU|nr:hypothetical protein CBR_g8168 [Chara braunii]|eukprot:GBG70868.1 hypothetical protein CBR_g8168 [Chara braunii]